jgi:hypothetical protein
MKMYHWLEPKVDDLENEVKRLYNITKALNQAILNHLDATVSMSKRIDLLETQLQELRDEIDHERQQNQE